MGKGTDMKRGYLIDVPILIVFFIRPNELDQVFERVKKARPSKLYLYQDGPRSGNENDMDLITQCREIVSDEKIDWECKVYKFYRESNVGVDPGEYFAIKWMFEHEEKGIILEDDVVPDASFFRFCDELLEKYKEDFRVSFISGRNNGGVSQELDSSYAFAGDGGSIWGWATWKRLVDTWDEKYLWLEDKDSLERIRKNIRNQPFDYFIEVSSQRRKEGVEYFETILEAALCLNGGLYVVPKVNLIRSIGMSENSVHNTSDPRLLPRRVRRLMELPSYEMEFPLRHPMEVKETKEFRPYRIMKRNTKLDLVEVGIRSMLYEGFKKTWNRIKKGILR